MAARGAPAVATSSGVIRTGNRPKPPSRHGPPSTTQVAQTAPSSRTQKTVQLRWVLLGCCEACLGTRVTNGGDASGSATVFSIAPQAVIDDPGDPNASIVMNPENIQLPFVLMRCGEWGTGWRHAGWSHTRAG